MDLSEIKSKLSSDLHPNIEHDGKNKLASILVVIYGQEPKVIMTEKPKDLKVHAGEISFPGGKPEDSDNDLLDTALRETKEEICLSISRDKVIGQLEPVTTLNSGFKIIPFVAIVDDVAPLEANAEVEKIFRIPFEPFLKTMADDPDPNHQSILEMFIFTFEGKTVWGASARVLNQIVKRLDI
ncbi:MAG: CoA pyrophosphatase [Nitrosopumilaceae archaeon]|nr:CoA pyrophosphatase [Nitrosopumilaceae archaeon]